MVSIKYILIVLYADDEGEGGTFALYSLLSRYVRLPAVEKILFCLQNDITDDRSRPISSNATPKNSP